jgi:hypothetical protein
VPTRTFGGACSTAIISAMKFAVIPMMEMREMACIPRTTVKVAPKAPKFGPCILTCWSGLGLGLGPSWDWGFVWAS